MPKLLKGLMLIAVLLSASCSTVVKKSSNQSSSIDLESANSQIAVDLLSIYRQITIPFSTTIQVSSLDETDMVSAAVQEFVQAGYGIQRVSTDQGANLLKVMRKQPTDNKSLFRYTLNVGNIYISRLYDVLATEVIPASAFEISGSLVVAEIEDAHFESAYPEQYRTIIYTNFESEKQEPTTVSLYTDTTTSDATNVSSLGKNSSQLEITNLFNSESVFQSVTQSHDRLARQVLVFANDSLVMGDNNKCWFANS